MATVSVSLPDPLEAFAAQQARKHGLGDAGEYLRALVDAARRQNEAIEEDLIEGLDSEPIAATPEFWADLRRDAARRRTV